MLERHKRQDKLLKLIAAQPAWNQSELVEHMRQAGFEVTQSSISRDLREMGVVKVAGRYVTPTQLRGAESAKGLQRYVQAIDLAGPHLVIVRTTSGSANLVAEMFDRQNISGVCGTLAGDNTIFIATKNKAAQARAVKNLKEIR